MIGALTLVLLIPALVVYFYRNAYKRLENFPPGPPSLPVYGGFWIVLAHEFRNLPEAFRKLGQKYKTKIVGLYMGSVPAVVVNDPVLIKEMLNREEFDGRSDIILSRLRSYWKKLGILFTDGHFWHVQRRFSFRYLRDYGLGTRDSILEGAIADEVKEMIDMGLNGPKYPAEEEIVKGDLAFIPLFFAVPFANSMVQVLSRSTLPRADYKELWDVARGAILFQRSSDDMGGALTITPWLKNILPNYSGYNSLVKGSTAVRVFFERLVQNAIETRDETYNRHFLDLYLAKMEEELKYNERSTFSVDQLTLACLDYMFPTVSTTLYTLAILIERMLLQPEIQDKIHEEIDRVVGRDRLPTLDDRKNMPYLESCLRETMRFDSMVPMGVPHRSMAPGKLGGYDIPVNTMMSQNMTMLHKDETIWGDPHNFRPERFIKDGQLDFAADKSIPFGSGRRLCPGETYSRQTMFQVLSGFMQTFRVSTADGKPLLKPAKRMHDLITSIPDFWVRITPRT